MIQMRASHARAITKFVHWSRGFAVMPIEMPALSPTMEAGNVGKWHKSPGDPISPGEAICEIETDKAVVEFESQEEGFFGKAVVHEGSQDIPVGKVIAYMVEEISELVELEDIKEESLVPSKEQKKAETITNKTVQPSIVTPAALFYINTHGLDVESIPASGPGGRLLKGDVLKFMKNFGDVSMHSNKTSTAPLESSKPTPKKQVLEEREDDRGFVDIPHTAMRKVIASRLTESKRNIPHAYASISCNLDTVLSLRKQLKESLEVSVSVNDFVIKAVAVALERVPEANVFWDERTETIQSFPSIDISVAVSTDGGLITPIVSNANRRGVSSISSAVKDLAVRARSGKLKPEEYQGGSFTISNLGMFGIKEFSAVINPPQACILAVGSGIPKIRIGEHAEPETFTSMCVTLSSDARVVDELIADRFLRTFKFLIEDPQRMIV